MQRLWLFGAVLVLAAALVSPRAAFAQGLASGPLAVVSSGLAALNAGNIAALTVLATEDTTLELLPGPGNGRLRIVGRDAVLSFWRQGATGGLQARPVGPLRGVGDRVTGTLRYTTLELRARGQAGQVNVEVTVVGGRIAAIVARDVTFVPLAQFDALPAGVLGLPGTGTGTDNGGGVTPRPLLAGLFGLAVLGSLAGLGGVTLTLALRGGRHPGG
jgi:hypothetical protein